MGKRKLFWWRETEADVALAPLAVTDSLADRIAAGPIPLAEALHYAVGMAEALREIHARGRAYGHLQPAGVRFVDGAVQLSAILPVALSPYFSPEQAAGREIDLRSDIFALGAILYEMLSGRPAFAAPTRTALRIEILDRHPAPLAGLPPAVSRLVMCCLEKKPERRLQRMEILLAALKLQEIMATPSA